jgi:hypothetical protein
MNRFVYLVHLGYRDFARPAAVASLGSPQHLADRLRRLPAELRRYLPDTQVRVCGEPIRRDPNVIRLAVMTTLDEDTADAAFIRFIKDCNATLLR